MYMYQQKLLFWQEISLSKHINISYISVGCRITTIYTFPFEKINHIIWQIIFVTYFLIFHLFIKLPGFGGDFSQKYQCSYFVCIFILFKNYHQKCFDISERRKCLKYLQGVVVGLNEEIFSGTTNSFNSRALRSKEGCQISWPKLVSMIRMLTSLR